MSNYQKDIEIELAEGIKHGNHLALEHVYENCFPVVKKMILSNSGTESEAQDVFQEAIMVLYDNLQKEDFVLTSSIRTFLYAVSHRMWLKNLTRNTTKNVSLDFSAEEGVEMWDFALEQHHEQERKFNKLSKALDLLGEPCKSVIVSFYLKDKTMKEISLKMGYSNSDSAKNQKYKCLQRLKKLMMGS